jgi:methanogenic corrinoid protein MtbC1
LNLPPLPDTRADAANPTADDECRLFDALCAGDRELARGLILSWYLRSRALHELFDGPIRGAMHRLGELWKHDERGILVEHRATDICLGVISGMRALLPAVQQSAPLALGGAPAGDPYQIPSLMAATTLAEAGWRDVNFGANTPLELLAAEAERSDARLVWLSVSAVDDVKSARAAVKRLASALAARDVPLVIGGHASADALPRGASGASGVRSMGELAAFARGLLSRASISPSAPIAR